MEMGEEGDYIPIAIFFSFFFFISRNMGCHTVFGGFISISGQWVLLCREPINAEDCGDITMQRTMF